LKEKSIDVEASVKASYAGFYGDVSGSGGTSSSQQNLINSSKKRTSNYYIGGTPPRNGVIADWQQ
jgi:hypothetical protein